MFFVQNERFFGCLTISTSVEALTDWTACIRLLINNFFCCCKKYILERTVMRTANSSLTVYLDFIWRIMKIFSLKYRNINQIHGSIFNSLSSAKKHRAGKIQLHLEREALDGRACSVLDPSSAQQVWQEVPALVPPEPTECAAALELPDTEVLLLGRPTRITCRARRGVRSEHRAPFSCSPLGSGASLTQRGQWARAALPCARALPCHCPLWWQSSFSSFSSSLRFAFS